MEAFQKMMSELKGNHAEQKKIAGEA